VIVTTAVPPTPRTGDLTHDFNWGQVSPQLTQAALATSTVEPQINPSLGPLALLANTTFRGNGFNTIFRPHKPGTPSGLPVTPDPATNPDDNILELNITEEILEFSSALGSVPNRGFLQDDIFFNGVPYIQRVKDVTDPSHPVDIHFEPGIWLSVPATTNPVEGATVVRMASIPHGTTIEAQGTSFTVPTPQINPVDITPFFLPPRNGPQSFPSQTFDNNATFRLPQDLSTTRITKTMLQDPNSVLTDRIQQQLQDQAITSTIVITIETNAVNPLPGGQPDAALDGGGTDNIAFLKGTAGGPNAEAVAMSAIFWIETVKDQITVPALQPGESVTLPGTDTAGDGLVPSFTFTATNAFAGGAKNVSFTQVQYTQRVHLNFAPLGWPHISVANLIPADPIPVTI
jgi:hypothetical protein